MNLGSLIARARETTANHPVRAHENRVKKVLLPRIDRVGWLAAQGFIPSTSKAAASALCISDLDGLLARAWQYRAGSVQCRCAERPAPRSIARAELPNLPGTVAKPPVARAKSVPDSIAGHVLLPFA